MKEFRLLSNEEGNSDFNFRPAQPLNGRKVDFYRLAGFTKNGRKRKHHKKEKEC